MVRRSMIGILLIKLSLAPVAAEDFSRQKEALEEIKKAAADICYTIDQKASGVQVSGEVQAKLKGLAAKLGELGIEGSGQVNQYQGVPWQDLANLLQRSQDCKQHVLDTLVDRLLPPPVPKTLYPQGMIQQPPQKAPPTQQPPQSVMTQPPPSMRPTPSLTRQEVLNCEMMREQVLEYERTHLQIAGIERINYADRCQNAGTVPPPDDTLRIKRGTRQFMDCVHLRDQILQAEEPRSPYTQMLAHETYMWNAAYCDRTDPPLTTTR